MSHAPDSSSREQSTTAASRDSENHGSRPRSLDTIFEILVAPRRRNALYVLYRRSGPVALGDLAEEVASVEGTESERVATGLHHVHLPKLVENGVAAYDSEAGTVHLVDHSERFSRYLLSAADDERRSIGITSEDGTRSDGG